MLQQYLRFCFFAWFGSHQQDKYQVIQSDACVGIVIDWKRIIVVSIILVGAILSNILYDMPALGVWIALVIGVFYHKSAMEGGSGGNQGNHISSLPCTCAPR